MSSDYVLLLNAT